MPNPPRSRCFSESQTSLRLSLRPRSPSRFLVLRISASYVCLGAHARARTRARVRVLACDCVCALACVRLRCACVFTTGPAVPVEQLPGVRFGAHSAGGHARRPLLHGARAAARKRASHVSVRMSTRAPPRQPPHARGNIQISPSFGLFFRVRERGCVSVHALAHSNIPVSFMCGIRGRRSRVRLNDRPASGQYSSAGPPQKNPPSRHGSRCIPPSRLYLSSSLHRADSLPYPGYPRCRFSDFLESR